MKPKSSPKQDPELSAGWRIFLYVTAATTGGAVMVVEILGAKMLSPYVGLSHFVWTAQIAVTLVALACGYYAGGRLADRSPELTWLYGAILVAAAYLALTVLICEPVAYWCLDFNLALGSLLASTILFFIPLGLLAMTAPFLVRVITSTVAGVGGNVGRLTSISTLGSFAGTMLIGYVAIPLLPNSFTMYCTAGALLLVCAVYFTVYRRRIVALLPSLLFLTLAIAATVYADVNRRYTWATELFRGNSHFGQLQVIDRKDGAARYYLNDNLVQNIYDPVKKQSAATFTYMLSSLARAYATNLNDVLCIGLGMGMVPMDFASHGAKVDVVEINPAVLSVATNFFDFKPININITFDDGRHYLNRCHKQYDVIVLDAFLGDSSPSHLLTREAFSSMRNVLRPGGTLVINCFGELEEGKDFFTASLQRTLSAVFPGVKLHSSGNGAVFFAATPRPNPVFVREPDLSGVHPSVLHEVEAALHSHLEATPAHGRVLTDNYNPVEFYDARNRENIRRRLALAVKDM
ncbi:MAG TPA: fused MFS/spermidine synthase [Verrucomicrobiae bacterium]|nr:fused MFS/spermidine synthase [Verrucomicrobiae bacterium]